MYSATVNLPKTDFNIRGMSKVREPEIQQFWDSKNVYQQLSRQSQGETFTLHDGPPYANGDLHCGHALNKILKDFINRRKLLEGRKAQFVPGWDTHGLPIELKVCSAPMLEDMCQTIAVMTIIRQRICAKPSHHRSGRRFCAPPSLCHSVCHGDGGCRCCKRCQTRKGRSWTRCSCVRKRATLR